MCVSGRTGTTRWTRFATAAGGRIDVLANNAGIPLGGALIENSPEEIERCLDINLKGVLFGAQAAYPYLKASAPGSRACSTRRAQRAFTVRQPPASIPRRNSACAPLPKASMAEWAEDGIKVRSIMPSFIDTPLLDHNPNAASNEDIRPRVTDAGLEITPVEDVAKAAWDAVHGEKLHTVVGKTAKSMAFGARWMPGRVRKMTRTAARPLGR